ncbi:hypothetical protein L227DRAFT_610100 [Lentinus tigrinus ALCF2SS1-6]|uniref:Uncharacterized protein n=1 Tax=Lentinus tigrinus ALCF2SS1-6 TaxID=1328759 RepID=A0A5C2SEC6_9APHY|nr:hypothetical protein L227DRAFT_610100 [Lentinus tigrinus ALCF2SS1-6]
MQGVPQFTNAAMVIPGYGPHVARFSLNGIVGPQEGRNISVYIDWQNRRTMFQVEYDNIDSAQGLMRAVNDVAAIHPLAQVPDRSDAPCRRACPATGHNRDTAAHPRTHQIRHGMPSAPRDVTPDANAGLQQTARRTGQLVSAEQTTDAPVKAGKVKAEKVKTEKAKKSTHTVKQEKILYPEKGNAAIRNSKKRTYWYKSKYHKPLPKPPAGLNPRRAALYVHHHDNGKQIWLWDEVSGDESQEGDPKYDWKRVREGISHPHHSLQGHVMHVVDDGTPRWVLARSRRERLHRKKRKELVADIDLTDE